MKRSLFLSLFILSLVPGFAQVKVSVLGDSYSTFKDWVPEGYAIWYTPSRTNTDVKNVEETWWHRLIEDNGLQLELNNSWSGTTICHTGYNGEDCSDKSFLARSGNLGNNPDIIYVFGGTNDDWAGVPIGEADGTDLYSLRPAVKAMFANIKEKYPESLCIAIINTELRPEITAAITDGCDAEGIPYIRLHAIDKQSGHPSINGMKAISSQVWKETAPLLYQHLRKQ